MAEHPIQGLMGVTIDKIREMVDTSTILFGAMRAMLSAAPSPCTR